MKPSRAAQALALSVMAGTATTTAAAQVRLDVVEVHMGVPVRVVLYAANDSAARVAARAAYARVAELDDKMSDYRRDSEVRGLERHRGDWTPVSPELFAVLARARVIAELTDGAFDPTVAPVVALWREARRAGRLPEHDALARALALVNWRALGLDSVRRAVRLAQEGMRLDLGGIAKGFILGEAVAALRAHGVGRALVEAGGDLVVGDAPPGRTGWRVQIAGADTMLTHVAMATSGATEQYVEIDGVRYSHVVDPRTGLGMRHRNVVTVLAADGATADAVATALNVLGRDAPVPWLGSSGVLRVYWAKAPPSSRQP